LSNVRKLILIGLVVAMGFAAQLDVTLADSVEPKPADGRSVADWLKTARAETVEQHTWESTHPHESLLLLGAGQYVTGLYGSVPGTKLAPGPPEFIAWWKTTGAAGFERWAKDGYPINVDRDHLIYNAMALCSAKNTPHTSATLYVDGYAVANPASLWAYYDRIKRTGNEVYFRGCAGQELSQDDYDTLRLYSPVVYSMWGAPYLPCDIGWTAHAINNYPTPGIKETDFTLPTLESILRSPAYTDAYSFDYRRPFHSEIAAFLLEVCNGYEAIPKNERTPGGPAIRAKSSEFSGANCATLSASRGKKPVLLILADGIDGYWLTTIGYMEPLYQATKDKIDWYFISDDIGDNIYWSDYYFKPSQAGGVTFQKALTMEDWAQTAKMMSMRYVNLSFPILLDDLAQHTQNAYNDQGGLAKVVLIDKTGTICMSNWLPPMVDYFNPGNIFVYRLMKLHCVTAANVKILLDNNGVWNGKDCVIPNWQPLPNVSDARITNINANTGQVIVTGADGKEISVTVDKKTRILFTDEKDPYKSLSDLTVGATISFTYEPDASRAGRSAGLILKGSSLNDFLTNSVSAAAPVFTTDKLWCPALATSVTDSVITAVLAPRPRSQIRGLNFWEQAGDKAKAGQLGWMIPIVKDWADRPNQVLTFHVDRSTQVIMNGMRGKLSDIRAGDHLGVEFRQEQKPGDRRPFFIFDYRYGASASERKN
jgi:hypothetical protein